MMLGIVLTVLSSPAFSADHHADLCPTLKGSYDCTGNAGTFFGGGNSLASIEQKATSAGQVYWSELGGKKRTADGHTRSFLDRDPTLGTKWRTLQTDSCTEKGALQTVTRNTTIDEDGKASDADLATATYSLTDDGVLKIVENYEYYVGNKTEKAVRESTCKPVAVESPQEPSHESEHDSGACPELEGTYTCKGTVKDFGPGTEHVIERESLRSGASYWLPKTDTGSANLYKRVANGKARVHKEVSPHIGELEVTQKDRCIAGKLFTSDVTRIYGDDSMTPFIETSTAYSITARGVLTISETLSQRIGGDVKKSSSKSVCKQVK